jgi:hypothetical protein
MRKLGLSIGVNFLGLGLFFSLISVTVFAANAFGDIDNNGKVDIFDYNQLLSDFGKTGTNLNSDLNSSGKVDIFDYNALLSNFGRIFAPSPSPSGVVSPSSSPAAASGEWTQFGQNSQRTGFTSQEVATPWKYKWQWNGAGADGKKQAGHLSSPNLVQPVTGGGRVYTVAADTVFALNKNNGSVFWQKTSIGTLSSTPVYDNEFLYVASGNNLVYKLNAYDGSVVSSFTAPVGFTLAPLLAGNNIYAVSTAGVLYKLDKNSMAKVWEYAGGSQSATPPAYSPSKNAVIYLTQDLYVHAVNNTDGTRKWRVKPTTRTYQSGNPGATGAQAEEGWPVIAEQHGIVFVRYRLDWETLWTWNPYPTTNAQIRTNLQSNPGVQALYALKMDDGTQAFVPAVGNAGPGDGGRLPMGTQPVVKVVNGKEVAYVIWRNGLTCAGGGWCDGREDATMGEMVLDNTTVSGYQAGDMRFVQYEDIQTDEAMAVTMSGDIIFHSHWLINAAKRITDRTDTKGATFTSPIVTSNAPYVIWRQVYCPPTNQNCNPIIYPGGSGFTYGTSNCPFNATTRYCSAGLSAYGDQRGYPAGFYEYHNDINSGSDPFTIVSDGLVLVKTNDGAIMALENGSPTAMSIGQRLAALFKREERSVLGEQRVTPDPIPYTEAGKYVNQKITVEGTIESAVNNLPKAIYLGFREPHDGALLIRVFNKDISKFDYDLMNLKGKRVRISGFVTMYWPDLIDPEIIVTDPNQIEIVK